MRQRNRVAALVTLGALGALILGACGVAPTESKHEKQSFGWPGKHKLIVEVVNSGDVRIEVGTSTTIEAERRFTTPTAKGSGEWALDGDRLRLVSPCKGEWAARCEMRYGVKVPTGVGIVITSSHGDVSVTGIEHGLDVSLAHGDVQADAVAGPLRLESKHGDIAAAKVRSTEVNAQTSNGDVSITFDTAPKSLEAISAHGNLDVALPKGDERYRVESKSAHGDVTSAITDDATADRVLVVRSSNGDISIRRTP